MVLNDGIHAAKVREHARPLVRDRPLALPTVALGNHPPLLLEGDERLLEFAVGQVGRC
jgi:hypothetical protein